MGGFIMDFMKKATAHDYTAWDLNCQYIHIKNRQKWEAAFKRKARRKEKQNLKKEIDSI